MTRPHNLTIIVLSLGLVLVFTTGFIRRPPGDDPTGVIAFSASRDGAQNIYVVDVVTGAERQLTFNTVNSGFNSYWPKWSSNGTQLTFYTSASGLNGKIYTMEATGHNLRNIINNEDEHYRPVFSPDSQRIAYEVWGDHSLEVVGVEDGVPQTLVNDITSYSPSWSPDGQTIAFSGSDDRTLIYLIDANGENRRALTREGNDWYPVWSPDGQHIAFASSRVGGFQIFVIDANGDNVRQITTASAESDIPTWSPDGQWLAFERGDQIWIIDINGENERQITTSGGEYPSWRPAVGG